VSGARTVSNRAMRALAIVFFSLLPILAMERRAEAQDRIVVRPEPGTPVVAVEVLVAAGSADEPADQAGVAYLTARAVTDPIAAVLDSLGARLAIAAHKDAVSLTLTAAPDAWEEATRALLAALFRDPVDSAAVVRQRRAIVRELEAREASPADALAGEVEKAVFGAEHPWGRPAVGTAETVARLRARQVDEFLRGSFTPERSIVAVVGPVEREEAFDVLRPALGFDTLRVTEADPPVPAESPVRRNYDAITTWVSASWHFTGDADVEALRMLSRLALQRVSFGPSRRSVYNSRGELLRHAAGGELRLHLVVPPREAEQWADALRQAVAGYAEEALSAQIFAERLRRYRGERLLELDLPETRARELARGVLLGGRGESLTGLDGLTPQRLHDAARALEAPIIVFLGPSVEEET
jgi:predicted Zn-dependent peptidase